MINSKNMLNISTEEHNAIILTYEMIFIFLVSIQILLILLIENIIYFQTIIIGFTNH